LYFDKVFEHLHSNPYCPEDVFIAKSKVMMVQPQEILNLIWNTSFIYLHRKRENILLITKPFITLVPPSGCNDCYLPARSTRLTVEVLVMLSPDSLGDFWVSVIATMVWARLGSTEVLKWGQENIILSPWTKWLPFK